MEVVVQNEIHDMKPVSTIISIVPFKIHEEKPGLYPGVFDIEPSENEQPEILVVGESIHYIEVDYDRSVAVNNPSYKIAKSIIDDYVISQIGVEPESLGNKGPGIFWKHGEYSKDKVLKMCTKELEAAKIRQRNWFLAMIQEADDIWEKVRQHNAIANTQRIAAKILGLERPWLISTSDILSMSTQKCPACGMVVIPNVVVCANCRCILNKEEYQKLQFASSK